MAEKKKKGFVFYLISAIVIIAVICAGAFFVKSLYVNIYGRYMFRTEKVLDLKDRGIEDISPVFQLDSLEYIDLEGNDISAEQYDSLREAYPGCNILWDIPLSYGTFSNQTEALSPASVTDADIALLPYFERLSYINLSNAGINDSVYETVKATVPGCTVVWETEVFGEKYPLDIKEISLSGKGLTTEALENVIGTFELLQAVKITDCEFSVPEQISVLNSHPEISFDWDVDLLGKKYHFDVKELSFRGLSSAEVDELKQAGGVLKNVEKIDFGSEVWNVEDIASLSESFNGAHVICSFYLINRNVSTTETELDYSNVKNIDITVFDKATYVMKDLKKVVMCDCGIDDETMDALNHKYDGVRFIWTVYVTRYYPLRTDRTYFCGSDRPSAGYVAVSLNDEEIVPLKYCIDMVAMDLGHMHFTNIDFVKDMKQLKYLVISCGNVHDISMISECESLYYFELFYNGIDSIEPILACKNLRYLNIGATWGYDKSPVFEMDFLDYLWYSHNRFSDEELDRLQKALPNTTCYLANEHADTVGGGWRNLDGYHELRDLLHMFY
ncbi:MAG: hypothetical protein K5771_09055 [Oscillospiraceae bacterium]|nr:hypothetical protein [Oscillospiraceae bacterium]